MTTPGDDSILSKDSPIADKIRDSTHSTMKKIDKQIPLYVKMNADIFRANNQLAETFIQAWYGMENMWPESLMRKEMLQAADVQIRIISDIARARADAFEGMLKMYPQMYTLGAKYAEQMMRGWVQVAAAAARYQSQNAAPKNKERK